MSDASKLKELAQELADEVVIFLPNKFEKALEKKVKEDFITLLVGDFWEDHHFEEIIKKLNKKVGKVSAAYLILYLFGHCVNQKQISFEHEIVEGMDQKDFIEVTSNVIYIGRRLPDNKQLYLIFRVEE